MMSPKKYKKKLQAYVAESVRLKVICFFSWLSALFFLYIFANKNSAEINNVSLTLVGITLTIFSINIATYSSILKERRGEVKTLSSYLEIDKELVELYKKYLYKRNRLLLYLLVSNSILVTTSIIAIMFIPISLYQNAFGFTSLLGTSTLMLSLVKDIYYIHKSDLCITVEKNN